MDGDCYNRRCWGNNNDRIYCSVTTCDARVHKPEPNGSPSSPRTRGSLPASQADSAFEGTGTQLAPVLCPPDPVLYDKPCGACRKCNPNLATFALCIHEIVVKYI